MKSIDTLTLHIKQWGLNRQITTNGRPMGQAIKMMEEAVETLDAVNLNDVSEIKDGIGDVYVTLVMLCGTLDIDIEDCIECAYEEIKDRTGHLRKDGTFVKDK